MLNFQNMTKIRRTYRSNKIKSISLILIAIAVFLMTIVFDNINHRSLAISPTIQNHQLSNILIAQNQKSNAAWIISLFQKSPKRRLGARNFNLTPISPGLVDTIISWNNKPLFLWDSNLNSTEYQNTKLIVREFDTQKQVWESNIDINQKKAVYNSKEQLRPGTLYVWLIEKEQEKEKSNLIEPTLFRIMSVKERKKLT